MRPLSWLFHVPTGCSAPGGFGAFALFWAVLSRQVPAHPAASPWHPAQRRLQGSFPTPGCPPGLPSSGAWAARKFPGPLVLLGSPPAPSPSWGAPPQVRARLPGLRGRDAGPPGGRFFGSGLGACCWQQGRAFAERRAGASKCGLGSRGTTILLAVGCWQRQGTWAHGCGRHLGGGRRLCRAEGGRAGTAVLAGRGLRASPQGLPLRAAVLRRWVWPQGVVARTGHQSPPELPRRPGRGWCPVQVQPRPHALLRKHLGRKGEYCPAGHICSLSGDGGGGEGLLGLWP